VAKRKRDPLGFRGFLRQRTPNTVQTLELASKVIVHAVTTDLHLR